MRTTAERARLAPSEEEVQISLLADLRRVPAPGWLRARANTAAEKTLADFVIHVPNGGARQGRNARRLQLAGVKPGVSDLLCFASPPGESWRGAAMELKRPGEYPTSDQREFLLLLHRFGWATCWTDDLFSARSWWLAYFEGELEHRDDEEILRRYLLDDSPALRGAD